MATRSARRIWRTQRKRYRHGGHAAVNGKDARHQKLHAMTVDLSIDCSLPYILPHFKRDEAHSKPATNPMEMPSHNATHNATHGDISIGAEASAGYHLMVLQGQPGVGSHRQPGGAGARPRSVVLLKLLRSQSASSPIPANNNPSVPGSGTSMRLTGNKAPLASTD
jgi:hypothetical protein